VGLISFFSHKERIRASRRWPFSFRSTPLWSAARGLLFFVLERPLQLAGSAFFLVSLLSSLWIKLGRSCAFFLFFPFFVRSSSGRIMPGIVDGDSFLTARWFAYLPLPLFLFPSVRARQGNFCDSPRPFGLKCLIAQGVLIIHFSLSLLLPRGN